MIEMVQQYMEKMGINGTQYLIVKHTDRQHPHIQLIFNRVDNNAVSISVVKYNGFGVKIQL